MPGLGMDRHNKRRNDERRGRRRLAGTGEDLRFSVMRVKAAMRNSPTQILRADDTRALGIVDRELLSAEGYSAEGGGNRFLRLPLDAARRAVATLRSLW